jgi:hypothetical protein
VSRAEGCLTTAADRSGICACCRPRLAEHGLGEDEIALLPARARQRLGRGPDGCVVDGCAREWVSSLWDVHDPLATSRDAVAQVGGSHVS